RLARISAGDRALLELLAVDAEGLRAVELAAAGGVDRTRVEEQLIRLARERLVAEVDGDGEPRYILAHPLMQQALFDALGAGARTQLHLALVQVFEPLAPRELGRLARHYLGAGRHVASARSLEVVTAAAEHAAEAHAPAEAASLYAAAVELARGL